MTAANVADLRSLDLLPGAGLQQEQIVSAFLALAGFNLDFYIASRFFGTEVAILTVQ
jgi:hypothetical protein